MENVVKEYKLTYKPTKREAKTIMDSQSAVEEFRNIFNPDTLNLFESFFVVYLNRANKVKGYMKISDGGMDSTMADPKLIYIGALESLATSIIIGHNHPSGNPRPSQEDKQLTEKIKKAGLLLGINLLDHVIISEEKYFSFSENGIL